MLLDFGGEWLRFSEDEGLTWSSVLPPEELREFYSYEGAVAVAPGGDIVAAGQDAVISGIVRAMTFKYEAAADKWFYSFAESGAPFLDRPAVGVIPGPFQIGGATYPYISVLRGGLLASKSYWAYSFDGLNYWTVNSRFLESSTSLPRTAPLEVESWGELDWMQPHELIGVAPLGHGSALAERPSIGTFDLESHAFRSVFDPTTMTWQRVEFPPDGPPQTGLANCAQEVDWPQCFASEGRTLADSRGNLHHISLQEAGIKYFFSSDGGAKWAVQTFPLPAGYTLPPNAELSKSFRASGEHQTTVVAIHAIQSQEPLVTRDLVFRFSFIKGPPKLARIYTLGSGEFSCVVGGVGVGEENAEGVCDFPSITLLAGGRVAVSFTDDKHPQPAVAIQLPETRR